MAMAESRDALDGIFCHFLPSSVEPQSTPPAHRLECTEALRASIIAVERAIRPVEYLAGTCRFRSGQTVTAIVKILFTFQLKRPNIAKGSSIEPAAG
jgi:hypothetical protein